MHIWIMGFLFCFPYSHFPRIVSSSLWRNQERYLWSKWEDTHRVDGAGMNIGPHFSLSLCFPSVTVISNYVTKTDYIRVIINKISEVHCEDCFLGAILNSELCHFWNALSHSRKLACVWEEIDLVQWWLFCSLCVFHCGKWSCHFWPLRIWSSKCRIQRSWMSWVRWRTNTKTWQSRSSLELWWD